MDQSRSNTGKVTKKSARGSTSKIKSSQVFTREEKAAMVEHAREIKAGEVDGNTAVLEKIAGMTEPDRSMARRVHEIIRTNAPGLTPRLWYGMPAYSMDGNVICHFQDAKKFKMRYATIGFSDKAKLDEGEMWPVAFALRALTPAGEAKIIALLKKAVS